MSLYNAMAQPHFDYKLLRSVEFTCLAGRLQGIHCREFRIGVQEQLGTAETNLVNQKFPCKL